MSTKKPKYPTTAAGYFCYLHDTGAVSTVNQVHKNVIICRTNSDGHEFRVDFILDKDYIHSEDNIHKHIKSGTYKIVNVRMY